MADIAPGLNFRIGADVKNLNKAIREAERSLKGAVASFSSIGNSLSLALSAPILAFGAASIKAAGDIESLRFAMEGTMKDAGRSTAEAAAEIEALRKAALAPGLDFKQAVTGSVRLQSVGFEAERAREIIVQLANALALSGGTADQLDGVTRQFAQMHAKGKVMQDDLRIILENMPALAGVMKKEFGTTSAEMLRDMGVNSAEFIDRLTAKMKDLPRASGGIANAIVNATNAVQLALASIGEEINKTFNISGLLNDFGTWVQNLAAWFKELDESTKRTIGAIVIFAATLGPAVKLLQFSVQIVGALRIAYLSFGKALVVINSASGLQGVVKWFSALNFVMKASIIGGITAVVLAAAAAFSVLGEETGYAAESQRKINETLREVTKETGQETAALNRNFAVLKDVNATQEQRRAAIKALQDQYPDYLGNIDLEKMSLGQLETVQNRVNQSILRSVAARKQAVLIDEQYAKIADTMLRISDIEKRGFEALTGEEVTQAGRSLFGTEFEKKFVMAEARAATVADALRALKGDVDNANISIKQIGTSFEQTFDAGQSVVGTEQWSKYYDEITKIPPVVKEQTSAVDELAKSYRELDKAQRLATRKEQAADLKKLVGMGDLAAIGKLPTMGEILPQETIDRFKELGESIKAVVGVTPQYFSAAIAMREINENVGFGLQDQSAKWKELSEGLINHGEILAGIGVAMVGTFEGVAAAGGGFKELADDVLGSLKRIVGGLIKAGVAAVVQGALIKNALLGAWAIPLGIAAGSLAQIAFNSILNKIQPPALAQGGVLTSPQLVMAGEYAGARTNPEIITPENKMRDVFKEVMRASNQSGVNGQLVAVVRGDDLLFVMEKAQNKASRKR